MHRVSKACNGQARGSVRTNMGMWERECKIESVGVLQDEACHIPASATGTVDTGMPCGGVTRHVECRQGVGHN